MNPPIFAALNASSALQALLGKPLRAWSFGVAPQPGTPGYALPYLVWQLVTGSPENYLGQLPDLDGYTTQVDVYATTRTAAIAVALAARDAIEPVAYIRSWRGESRDTETALYRVSFDVDWLTPRI